METLTYLPSESWKETIQVNLNLYIVLILIII